MFSFPIGRIQGNTTIQLLLLEYDGRQTVIPRPQGYQALRQSLRRYLPDIPDDHDTFVFETNELPISHGRWVGISEDAWESVVPLIEVIKVVSSTSARNRSRTHTLTRLASQITAGPSQPDLYNLFIRTLTGRTLNISCSRTDTIAQVKEIIHRRDGIPTCMQRLIFAGRQLEDDYTLSYYGIQVDSTLHLVTRLTGGKPVIYIYPPTPTRVTARLSLAPQWEFSAIYPVVSIKTSPRGQEVEWVVDASPNGALRDVNTGLEVSYLYWEAETQTHGLLSPPASPVLGPTDDTTEVFLPNHPFLNTKNSVLLKTGEITPYLDKSLKALGLHVEARTSFVTYWLPSILKHKYVALQFLPQSAYERAAPLRLEPTPDVVVRIFMLFRGVDEADLGLWAESCERSNLPVEYWRGVVGISDVDQLQDAKLLRVIEWGGMEVR